MATKTTTRKQTTDLDKQLEIARAQQAIEEAKARRAEAELQTARANQAAQSSNIRGADTPEKNEARWREYFGKCKYSVAKTPKGKRGGEQHAIFISIDGGRPFPVKMHRQLLCLAHFDRDRFDAYLNKMIEAMLAEGYVTSKAAQEFDLSEFE